MKQPPNNWLYDDDEQKDAIWELWLPNDGLDLSHDEAMEKASSLTAAHPGLSLGMRWDLLQDVEAAWYGQAEEPPTTGGGDD